jgi:hypothetical protein
MRQHLKVMLSLQKATPSQQKATPSLQKAMPSLQKAMPSLPWKVLLPHHKVARRQRILVPASEEPSFLRRLYFYTASGVK